MIAVIKPLILQFVATDSVKRLVVSILEKLAASTESKVDDDLVAFVKRGLEVD